MVDVDLELDLLVNSISNLPNQFQFQWRSLRSVRLRMLGMHIVTSACRATSVDASNAEQE